MTGLRALLLAVAAGLAPAAAAAQTTASGFEGAVGADASYSTDADKTEVVRAAANFDVSYDGREDYRGFRLERAWFNPLGQGWSKDDRVYLRAADKLGGWNWSVNAGTDGHTALGAISLHDNAAFRKELFVEREIVETPLGVDRGIYYTFVGGALDLPLDDRNVATVVAGLQAFTGNNRRLHLRANFVHVLRPEWGLSVQLRARWFHSSDPGEFDYYSPRWYAQVLPVIQLRRTTDKGWRFLAVGGLGVQRDSTSKWRSSGYLNLQATSPNVARGWALTAAATFSETPSASGLSYSYLQVSAGVVRAF